MASLEAPLAHAGSGQTRKCRSVCCVLTFQTEIKTHRLVSMPVVDLAIATAVILHRYLFGGKNKWGAGGLRLSLGTPWKMVRPKPHWHYLLRPCCIVPLTVNNMWWAAPALGTDFPKDTVYLKWACFQFSQNCLFSRIFIPKKPSLWCKISSFKCC